jgi:hypothetical protein
MNETSSRVSIAAGAAAVLAVLGLVLSQTMPTAGPILLIVLLASAGASAFAAMTA